MQLLWSLYSEPHTVTQIMADGVALEKADIVKFLYELELKGIR